MTRSRYKIIGQPNYLWGLHGKVGGEGVTKKDGGEGKRSEWEIGKDMQQTGVD